MKEKYVRTDEIFKDVELDELAAMDEFMGIFGYKRVKDTPTQEKCPMIPTNIEYYEGRIARRMHWDENEKTKFFGSLLAINENCYISMMIKEIARKIYGEGGFIVKDPNQEIFMINLGTFEILPFRYSTISNPRAYTIFRDKKDASLAIQIISRKFAHESK